jgi:predicted GNAT family acetyltransferase
MFIERSNISIAAQRKWMRRMKDAIVDIAESTRQRDRSGRINLFPVVVVYAHESFSDNATIQRCRGL